MGSIEAVTEVAWAFAVGAIHTSRRTRVVSIIVMIRPSVGTGRRRRTVAICAGGRPFEISMMQQKQTMVAALVLARIGQRPWRRGYHCFEMTSSVREVVVVVYRCEQIEPK
jgi:hypothetical protein